MFSWTSTLTPTLHWTHPWVLDALAPQNVWRYFVTSPLRREQIFGGKSSDKAWTAVLSHTWSTQAGFGGAIRELFARTRQLGSLCPARTPLNTDNSFYLAVVASQGLGWGGGPGGLFCSWHIFDAWLRVDPSKINTLSPRDVCKLTSPMSWTTLSAFGSSSTRHTPIKKAIKEARLG